MWLKNGHWDKFIATTGFTTAVGQRATSKWKVNQCFVTFVSKKFLERIHWEKIISTWHSYSNWSEKDNNIHWTTGKFRCLRSLVPTPDEFIWFYLDRGTSQNAIQFIHQYPWPHVWLHWTVWQSLPLKFGSGGNYVKNRSAGKVADWLKC